MLFKLIWKFFFKNLLYQSKKKNLGTNYLPLFISHCNPTVIKFRIHKPKIRNKFEFICLFILAGSGKNNSGSGKKFESGTGTLKFTQKKYLSPNFNSISNVRIRQKKIIRTDPASDHQCCGAGPFLTGSRFFLGRLQLRLRLLL